MKTVCTTSDGYSHLIPIFIYLFNKYWPDEECEIVGYTAPDFELPGNFTFHSMGVQGDVSEWSTDLRKFFEGLEETHIIWLMEDTILKAPVDARQMDLACALMMPNVGRIDLTGDIQKRAHRKDVSGIVWAMPDTRYRLSTQPSIWNREFLLKYLVDGLNPWVFETLDPVKDDWVIAGVDPPPVRHNEGVRKHDRYALDLNGLAQDDIYYIKNLCPWIK